MNVHKEEFTLRQFMEEKDFEFHHYLDPVPPEVPFHEHPFYEIFFFVSGNVNYIIEGRTYQLRPGDILLTSNRDIHRPVIAPGKPYERYVIWMEDDFFTRFQDWGDDLSACFNDTARKKYQLIRPDSHLLTHLKKQSEYMAQIKAEKHFGSRTLLYACLIEFLVYLNRAYFDTPDSIRNDITENDKINEVVAYINDNLTESLSLDHLAQTFYVSKFHLSNKFKQYTGLTLYQFIMKKRLTVARNMLRTGVPVTDACLRCGFNDYSNFLKAFKREFGHNPSEYIRRQP